MAMPIMGGAGFTNPSIAKAINKPKTPPPPKLSRGTRLKLLHRTIPLRLKYYPTTGGCSLTRPPIQIRRIPQYVKMHTSSCLEKYINKNRCTENV